MTFRRARSQQELLELILMKKGEDGLPVPYNVQLRNLYRLLSEGPCDPYYLDLIETGIWNALPKWRKNQISREAANG